MHSFKKKLIEIRIKSALLALGRMDLIYGESNHLTLVSDKDCTTLILSAFN